jgi:xylulokinase
VLAVLNSLADAQELLRVRGIPVEKVLLIGGGSKSRALRQAAADVFGVPVEVPAPAEYVALGAARQAAWAATGSLPQWKPALDAAYEPDPGADWGAEVRRRFTAARASLYGV